MLNDGFKCHDGNILGTSENSSRSRSRSLVQVKVIGAMGRSLRIHGASNHILLNIAEVINDGHIVINHSSRNFTLPLNLAKLQGGLILAQFHIIHEKQ